MDLLIAGGGTGGHLFPGIAVAQEVRRRHPQARILFVGTARGIETRAVPAAGFDLALLPVRGLRNKDLKSQLHGAALLPWAAARAALLVGRFRPQVAVSVGGYAAGPAMVAARLFGARCLVLEQNAVAGVTTRLLAKLAHKVILSMPCEGVPADRGVILGNPVRAALLPVRQVPYAPHQPLNILVLGGSQGAHALNDVMVRLLPLLLQQDIKCRIVHQTGATDADKVQESYRAAGFKNAAVKAFISDMAQAYSECDVVVCRAGATTLAELTVCGRPAVLVPFPHAAGDHQTINAQALASCGAALCVPQTEFTPEGLCALLRDWAQDQAPLVRMAACSRAQGKPDALERITDCLEDEARHV